MKSIKSGLNKTRDKINGTFNAILTIGRKVDEDFLEELEDALINSDVGPRLALEIVEDIRTKYKLREIKKADEIIDFIKNDLTCRLTEKNISLCKSSDGPTVIMLIGVNGSGKTTTAAKLARRYRQEGKKVLLAAADTFRAAAGEQLDIWADKVGVDIVKHASGADPAAVVFDACDAALARGIEYLIIDTAGRLHTKDNLMRELEKIHRVAGKKIPDAPHEALLVLDSTTGQNALSQAKNFSQGVGLTGLVLTKLDGTAKGGVAVAINNDVDLPIKLIGVGESAEDLLDFDPQNYISAMFSSVSAETEVEEPVEADENNDV
ncbi:MAG: signal recognition particle-docking protein FtsY [Planctomycetota bacterium]